MTSQIDSSIVAIAHDRAALTLPLDHPRILGRPSSRLAELPFVLSPEASQHLANVARQSRVSRSSVCLAAYAVLLNRYSNTPKLDIYVPADKCEGVVPVQVDYQGGLSLPEFMLAIADQKAAASQLRAKAVPGLGSVGYLWKTIERASTVESFVKTVTVEHEHVDLLLAVQCPGSVIEAALLYRPDLFERETIERMSRHWIRLIEAMADSPRAPLAELEMLPAEEQALILGLCAGSTSDYPKLCVHELFAQHATQHPDAEAVVYGTKRLSYRELDQKSNQIAHFLLGMGIQQEGRVGIFMDRSADMIVAMLGILKAGGTYVPVDIDYPAERLKFIAEDTDLLLVLTQHSVSVTFPSSAPLVCVDTVDSPIHNCRRESVPNRSVPESIAVVNYTSGSTGQPKAACIPHRAIARTVRNTNYIVVTPEDRVAQAGSPAFDAAIMEIWLALGNGAAVVGMRRETLLSPAELSRVLPAEKVSILVLNTSYVHQIARDAPEAFKGVRKVLFGGEAAEPAPLRALLEHVGPGVLVNSYGPAEGCVITSYHEITNIPEDALTVPIGRPVSNTQVYLLDARQQLVPMGTPGEIYIGGEGVARGYLNRPDLTTQRFFPDTFSGRPDRLLYRTGDFARMRGDGEIEFIGRTDEQVKIRGHRIELAEVRYAIVSHPVVKQLFLMVREDVPGDKRLIAYVTLHHALPAAQETLRQHAVDRLPIEMVPAGFVVMDAIPLNVNGKVDRKALPAPTDRPELPDNYQAPGTDLEHQLMLIWKQLLRLDQVGVNDNFFDLGGHSLLAARLIARIEKQIGTNIPMATLFEAPTIAQLTARLKQHNFEVGWSPLVELHILDNQALAAKPPFFCVHSLGANLVSFHNVAALMEGDRPIYGLQPHGLDGKQKPIESIELMASAYLQEIRKKQPHGPYHLGGICLGGVIAYEIAQQLRAAGETVAIVALIDSYVPGALRYLRSRASLTEYLDRHLGEMLLLPVFARLKYMARWLANGGVRIGRAVGLREHSSLARATRKIAAAHRRAVFSYQPKPYDGKVIQLMCSDASHRSYEDRRLAWSSLALLGFEVRIVPGDHHSMVEEPHAQVLAQELQTCLDRASGTAGPIAVPIQWKQHFQGPTPLRVSQTHAILAR